MESKREANGLGESKPKDGRFRLNGAAMAGPPSQNPKGRRLLNLGLMLLPLSLKLFGKTTSFKT